MNFDELREKYDSFIASLEEKGVPQPRILVPAVALIVVLALVYFFVLAPSLAPTKNISLTVKNAATNQPVVGATVTLQCADCVENQKRVGTTAGDGIVVFEKIPEKAAATLRVGVAAAGFQTVVSQPFPTDSGVVSLAPEVVQQTTKTIVIHVKDALGNDVEGAQVLFASDDGSAKMGSTDSFGEATIQVPADQLPAHATVTVEKTGFGKKQSSVSQTDFDNIIYVELAASTDTAGADNSHQTDGTLIVRAHDDAGAAVSGATISIVDYYSESVLREGKTLDDGTVAFDKVALGTKFRILAKHSLYDAFSSPDYYEFKTDSSVFSISLTKKTLPDSNSLKVEVFDADNNAVSGAKASVYDRATKTLLSTEATDENGEAIVSAQAGRALYLTVYAPGFLPAFDEYVQAGDVKKIVLEKEAAGNFIDVTAHIKKDGDPAPNALIDLYQSNGFPLGVPSQYSDADGSAVFRVPARLKNTNYGVYAVSSLDKSRGRSDIVTVTQDAELFVNLAPEPALLVVQARDIVSNESIEGATITLSVDGAEVNSCDTKKNGCNFTVAPDAEFVLAATATSYLRAETSTMIVGAGETATALVYLYPSALVKAPSSRFLGFFDASGKQARELGNAEYYDARFLVTVPSSADETHFFASFGDKASADEDFIAISGFDANVAPTVYSGASSGEDCVGTNASASASLEGLQKWVLFVLPKGFVGTKEVALRVYVKPSAHAGDTTHVYHRLSGIKKNVPFLAPADQDLLNGLLQKTQGGVALKAEDFCNAKLNVEKISVTQDPLLCDSGNCYKLVFRDDGGQRSRTGFVAALGKEFLLDFTLLSEVNEIVELGVQTSDALQFVGFEAAGAGGNLSSARELSFQDSATAGAGETRVSLSAAPGEKVSGTLRFKALRASAFAPITLNVYFSDPNEAPFTISPSVRVSGTNLLKVDATPTDMVAGLKENVRVNVKDSLGAPVTDATVFFYECDGAPLNGQEVEVQGDGSRDNGEDGGYRVSLSPSTIGSIGLRVSRDGFKSFDSCLINVDAGEFIEAVPQILKIEGDSRYPAKLTKQITLNSLLPVTSRVSTSVFCAPKDENGSFEIPIEVVPQSFTLKDSMTVEVSPNENATARSDCYISFTARVNDKNSFVATVLAQVNVYAPATPVYCPTTTEGFKCLIASKAGSNCVAQPQFVCPTSTGLTAQCFACESGETTLPTSFDLTVGLTNPSDSSLKEVFLDEAPDECSIEGFDLNPAQLPSSYYNQYYGTTPANSWNYQTTPWNNNNQLWTTNAQSLQYNYLQGYNPYSPYSQTGSATTGTAGYQTQATGYTYPSYGSCPSNLNTQSMAGSYYGNSYSNPWQQGYASDYPTQCQYPYVCQNPSLCSYATAGLSGTTGANFYSPVGSYGAAYGGVSAYGGVGTSYSSACQYPAVCSAPQACPSLSSSYSNSAYPQSSQYYNNYQQSKPPVTVTVDSCTQYELQVTAKYTGNDYFYNNALGGTQSGYLVVKISGKTKRIPVTVTVVSPTTLYPSTYQGSMIPSAYSYPLTSTLPLSCLPGMTTVQQTTQTQAMQGLDELGLPTDITIKVNKFSCEGEYERQIPAPAGRSLLHGNVVGASTQPPTVSGSTLKIDVKQKKSSDGQCEVKSESGTIKLWWSGTAANLVKEVPVSIEEDDIPGTDDGRIMLYADSKEFTQSFDAIQGAKCDGSTSHIKVKCSGAVRGAQGGQTPPAGGGQTPPAGGSEATGGSNELTVSWDGKQADKTTLKITHASDWNNRKISVEASASKATGLDTGQLEYYKTEKEFNYVRPPKILDAGDTRTVIYASKKSDAECETKLGEFATKSDTGKVSLASTGVKEEDANKFVDNSYGFYQVVNKQGTKEVKSACAQIIPQENRSSPVGGGGTGGVTGGAGVVALPAEQRGKLCTAGDRRQGYCASETDCTNAGGDVVKLDDCKTEAGKPICCVAKASAFKLANFRFVQVLSNKLVLYGTFTGVNVWKTYDFELYSQPQQGSYDERTVLYKLSKKVVDSEIPSGKNEFWITINAVTPRTPRGAEAPEAFNDPLYAANQQVRAGELIYAKLTMYDEKGVVIGAGVTPSNPAGAAALRQTFKDSFGLTAEEAAAAAATAAGYHADYLQPCLENKWAPACGLDSKCVWRIRAPGWFVGEAAVAATPLIIPAGLAAGAQAAWAGICCPACKGCNDGQGTQMRWYEIKGRTCGYMKIKAFYDVK